MPITPHPLTRDLKALPVPDLSSTLEAYIHALEAVLDETELAEAKAIVADFAQSQAPRLDEALRQRAATREAEGTNWLSDEWYSSYLATRGPLTLTTNVGFQLALPSEETGLDRVVDGIRRALVVHLQAAGDDLPDYVDARGNRITQDQWFVFGGGLRHPSAGEDEIIVATAGTANREIGVFVDGHLYAVPVTDEAGEPIAAPNLRNALETVLDAPRKQSVDFNAASLLGSETLAEVLPDMLAQGDNGDVYKRLQEFLFTVDLIDYGVTTHASDEERINELTFLPRGAWTYKPLSYQFSLTDPWSAVHVEHSCQDGGTLVTAITRMQEAEIGVGADFVAKPQELRWDLDDALTTRIEKSVAEVAGAAEKLRTRIVHVPFDQPADLPLKFSRDASAQLMMTIAQQLTYGRVRAAYEAVDMREFRAGRTECLRAATPEAAAFARALVEGTAEQAGLEDAINAHRAWVKRCKSGNGFDRHIQMMATIDDTHAFFNDTRVTAARRDFLSTTSIGGAAQIVRYCFAPALPEGFGIAYTPLHDDTEYCVSWNAATAEQPEEFLANLTKAGELLWQFCATLSTNAE
ncbi:choline/carnitine O-acyltransferase [uncultured Corynebacterium sp.]|uniref:choline/carnitine O-acyltransferase n=1 Tax=uncultured Corynebacterium sp. TaxID=159447 RepID=UPI0025957255|nr:choline/carnitine O-acyltransferase [uncultured Corynebacterium sp.]